MNEEAEHEEHSAADEQSAHDEADATAEVAVDSVADSAATTAHHDSVTHMDAHTTLSDDDHGHGEEALGPIDWGAWAVAIVSGAAALLVVALFWVAIS